MIFIDSINVLSLFDGMSCGYIAFKELGFNIENYYAYEIDKYAIKTTLHNFPDVQELGNVFDADFSIYKDKNIDWLVGGSPCFTKGHLILTNKGYKDISDIRVGDLVLTHTGRFQKVVRTNTRTAETVKVNVMGYPEFITTMNHPFYCIRRYKCDYSEYIKLHTYRKFSVVPKWKEAKDLDKDDFCGQHILKSLNKNDFDLDKETCYILGRYLADGHIRKNKRKNRKNSYQYGVVLSIGSCKLARFKSKISNFHYSCYHHSQNVYRCVFSSKKLVDFIINHNFGLGAVNKRIPEFVFNLPNELRLSFLEGYVDGDGCYSVINNSYSLSTVSKELALCMQRLITSIYKTNASVMVSTNNKKHCVDGREIHSNYPLYTVIYKHGLRKQSVAHIQNDIVWTQVKSVSPTVMSETVYNIEVENDNSYTVNNCIVHNCTYWSIAQSPDKRETTASGMGWELFSQYARAIKEVKPKYFLYENNKSMAKAVYNSISETFGFEPIMINSALVSAQSRQRYYWVGKRNEDGTYSKVNIEQPEDKGILLKDVLDGVVDREKSRAIIGSIGRTTEREYFKKFQGQLSFEPVNTTVDGKAQCLRATCYKDGIRNLVGNDFDRRTAVAEPVGTTKDGKSYCLTSGYSNGSGENIGNYVTHTLEKGCKSMVAEPVACRCRGRIDKDGNGYAKYECRQDGKANTLDTNTVNGAMVAEPVQVGALPRPNGELSKSQAFRIYDTNAKSVTLKAGGGGAGGKTGLYAIPVTPIKIGEIGNGGQGNRIYSIDGKAVTQQSNSGGLGSNTGLYAQPVYKELTEREMDYMVRDHADRRWNFMVKPGEKDKSPTITANISRGVPYNVCAIPVEFDGDIPTKAISYANGKTYKVHEVKDGLITIKEKQYPIKLQDGYYIIRKLTVSECKRLQTVPEWYEFPVSDTQGYKMLGNCWTVDVIVHLIQSTINKDSDKGEIKVR